MADKLTLDRHDMKNRATAHLRIYVGGLTDKATVDEIYEHFIPYGQINGIIVNRNFGFVQFEHESSAQDAISKGNNSMFQGKNLTVRTAVSNPEKNLHQPTAGQSPPSVSSISPYSMPSPGLPVRKRSRSSRLKCHGLPRRRRETEIVTVQSDIPPAVALNDNNIIEEGDECYDNFGNYIGDQSKKQDKQGFREDEFEHEDAYSQGWKEARAEPRGRGGPRGGPRGRGPRGRGGPGAFHERSPVSGRGGGDWVERGNYERFTQPEYPRALPLPERNDCEIIVVSKALTEYAEYIEGRLKRLGIVVDLLFPMEDVPIGKVLGNIASRGCLYAILVMPQNQEHRSLTLTILHGLPQEHRNMPLEDALQLLSRNFQEVQRGGPSGREAVYALLGQLADGRTLTVLQYDKVLEYMQERREQQVKIELGEPMPTPANSKTQVDLQQRILSILNDKSAPEPPPAAPVAPPQNKLLNDPTVRKALDSILQKFA